MILDLVVSNSEPGFLEPTAAHIYISESGADANGRTTIGYECASYGELEGVVKLLKQDLDSILQKGRKAFF